MLPLSTHLFSHWSISLRYLQIQWIVHDGVEVIYSSIVINNVPIHTITEVRGLGDTR
jgi:hypothetical protein